MRHRVLGLVVLLAACGRTNAPPAPRAVEVDGRDVWQIQTQRCEGDCGNVFYVNRLAYSWPEGCGSLGDADLGDLYAAGTGDLDGVTARRLRGHPIEVGLGIRRPGCDAWAVATGQPEGLDARIDVLRLQCGDDPHPNLVPTCEAGGPVWDGDGGWGWLPEVVDEVNARRRAGEDVGSATPEAATAAFWRHQNGEDPSSFRRAGLVLLDLGDGTTRVRVTTQHSAGPGPTYSSSAATYVVEQLRGGPGWWVTSGREDGPYAQQLSRAEVDERWASCCEEVIVDQPSSS